MSDPLAVARACAILEKEIRSFNVVLGSSSDMVAFNEAKKRVRGFDVSPMHHHEVADFSHERGFWLYLENPVGEIIALQGFRLDEIDTNLADWGLTYMIGLYMRRKELIIPSHARPAKGSIAERISGKVAYHGEIWMAKPYRNRTLIEHFIRIALISAYIKWQPDAIWCLASSHMVERGHLSRAGYPVYEPGFMRWQMITDGIDPHEALFLAEPQAIEAMIEVWGSKSAQYQQELEHKQSGPGSTQPPPLTQG